MGVGRPEVVFQILRPNGRSRSPEPERLASNTEIRQVMTRAERVFYLKWMYGTGPNEGLGASGLSRVCPPWWRLGQIAGPVRRRARFACSHACVAERVAGL